MTPGLYQAYFDTARQVAAAGKVRLGFTQARKMEVVFSLSPDKHLTLDMFMGKHPAYGFGLDTVTPIDELAWAGVGPAESLANYRLPDGSRVAGSFPFDDVMLLGLGFLVGRSFRIDTKQGCVAFSPRTLQG